VKPWERPLREFHDPPARRPSATRDKRGSSGATTSISPNTSLPDLARRRRGPLRHRLRRLAYIDDDVKQLALVPPAGGAAVKPGYDEVIAARYPLCRLGVLQHQQAPRPAVSTPVLANSSVQ